MTLNKLNIIRYSFIFLVAIASVGCSMFFEDDIETEKLSILAPADDTTTEILTHVFWWETVSGAERYHLQIVSPSFEETEIMLLDSIIKGDKFEMTLYPEEFQWRIRGENSAYETNWTYAKISILDSDDLGRQRIILKIPVENRYTNDKNISFTWNILNNAETYDFKIYKNSWGEIAVIDSSKIADSHIDMEDLNEGEYWWGVKAINNISETLFATRRVVVDRTPPVKPMLQQPLNNANLSDSTITFSWSSNDPIWKTVVDKLIIKENRDGSTYVEIHSETYKAKSANVKLFRGRKYSWKVASVDQAGNESELSEERFFNINN